MGGYRRLRPWALMLLGLGSGLGLSAAAAAADRQAPLWEVGAGFGGLLFPDYRGSDESKLYPVPVPYFVYRGDFLKADRDGVRGELFRGSGIELKLSINATIPVSSDNNDARAGMPDLKSTLELGPALDVSLWESADERMRLELQVPLRAPVTLESSPRGIGWLLSPRLNLDVADVGGFSGWNLGLGVGPIFADQRYHDYFYSVDPEYATAWRPAYEADGGYSGAQFVAALSKRYPRFWVGGYVRYDNLSGATFEDSPLVRRRHYAAAGFAVAWILGQSSEQVPIER